MNPANIVDDLIKDIKERLTLDGKNKVFEEGMELRSEFMKEKAEPEAFTKEFLVDKILDAFGLEKLPEKSFETPSGYRSVDYRIKSKERMFLVEAKPLNADLYEKSKAGGFNQIKGLFKLVEVKENYDFGVATDGLRWVFIDRTGKIVVDLRLEENFEKIKEFLAGKERVVSPETEEEVSKKFYDWYNALLHGGRYKDHENKLKSVSEADCVVSNVIGVKDLEEREQIAQVVMNRLIFIKFLQSKGIIGEDILKYLSEVKEDLLTPRLRQLFFGILNTPEGERFDVNERFKDIPYLNGSLFVHTEVEKRNVNYKIKAEILKKVIEFLDSFKFVHKELMENESSIDPEILGYIFERAMTATDRKGTGAYYTPRQITRYISENTIHHYIIDRTNEFLKAKKGYKETELVEDIEKLFILPATTLEEIWKEIIQKIRVLDNACGSGAFLLAAANILFELNRRIDDKLGLGNSDIALKKWILMHNLYGVDINPSGIEIAKLRLWLWLVDSYEPKRVEPLPNIDYNLRVGNSLIGYVDISEFKETKLNFLNYFWEEEKPTLDEFLNERNPLLQKYKRAEGEEARELKKKINGRDEKIKKLLDANFYLKLKPKKIKISKEEFLNLKPFHWGFEFYEVFDAEKPKEEWGFDVVIGNPPYGNILKGEERVWINNTYPFKEHFDIYPTFIERSFFSLRKSGLLGYIVPSSWETGVRYSKFREYLLEKYSLVQTINMPFDVFQEAYVDNCISIFKNIISEDTDKVMIYSYHKKSKIDNLNRLKIKDKIRYKLITSDEDKRIFPNPDIYKLIEYMGESCNYDPLGNITDSTIGILASKYKFSEKKVNEYHLPYIEGRCDRYICQLEFKKYLDFKQHFNNKQYLDYYRSKGKIVIRRIVNRQDRIMCSFLTEEGVVKKDLYIFTMLSKEVNPFYLLALLNSKLISYFYVNKSTVALKDDFRQTTLKELRELPIIKVSFTEQGPFIALSKYLLFLNETEERRKTEKELIEFIDKQVIDSLVYELYFNEKFKEEGLKTNILGVVEPYLKGIENLKTGEEKLKLIKEVVEKIKSDRKVRGGIEKIKSNEWVKIIEEMKQ